MAAVYIVQDDNRIIHGVYSNKKEAVKHKTALDRQGSVMVKVTREVPRRVF